MLTVMAKSKSKEKKGKRAKLSKVRKKGSRKKKNVTAKARKGAKKNAAGRKATPRPKVTHAETTSAPAAFTEIASEEMTSSPPSPGEPAMIESTESTGASESGFTPTEDNSNSNNTSSM
jgi:hypothetical protein